MIKTTVILDEQKAAKLMDYYEEKNFSKMLRNLVDEKLDYIENGVQDNMDLFPEIRLVEPQVLEIKTKGGLCVTMSQERAVNLIDRKLISVDNNNFYFSLGGRLPNRYFRNIERKKREAENLWQ